MNKNLYLSTAAYLWCNFFTTEKNKEFVKCLGLFYDLQILQKFLEFDHSYVLYYEGVLTQNS